MLSSRQTLFDPGKNRSRGKRGSSIRCKAPHERRRPPSWFAEAAVKEAEIQLGYCAIKAPIGGRVGRRMVDAGNVVTANTTELVIINQVRPIDVIFAIPEQRLADHHPLYGRRKAQGESRAAGKTKPAG
jgi:multidrug efflux system membrane fusion protein